MSCHDLSACLALQPPVAACHTRIWHPNITEDGKICLRSEKSTEIRIKVGINWVLSSILREHALDGTGWLPTRTLKVIVMYLCVTC